MLYLCDHSGVVVLGAVDPPVFTALLPQVGRFRHRQVPEGGLQARRRQVLHQAQLIPAAAAPLWLPVRLRRDIMIMSYYSLEGDAPSTGLTSADRFLRLAGSKQPAHHQLGPIQWSEGKKKSTFNLGN